jgi:hypothetical protein
MVLPAARTNRAGRDNASEFSRPDAGAPGTAGDLLYAPMADMIVSTAHGEIQIKAGSLVYVTTSGTTTAIYNLHDSCKNAVNVATSSGIRPLLPGSMIILSSKESIDLSSSNPVWSIGHRNVRTSAMGDTNVTLAEFSLASAITRMPAVVALLQSKNPQERRLAQQLLKTAAVLTFVNKNSEPFRPLQRNPLLSINR